MAFTADQTVTLSEICGLSYLEMRDYLVFFNSITTSQVESQIAADIILWNENRDDFTEIHPQTTNRGASVNPQNLRDAITKRVKLKLNLNTTGGFSLQRLIRV